MSFFRRREPRPPTEKIENIIGPSATVSGHLKAKGGVRVDGSFEGKIESESNVIIGEKAQVVADISGFNIIVAGSVEGTVKAAGRLKILSTGRIVGDVQAGSLLIEEGGLFHGQSLMEAEEQVEPEAKPRTVGAPAGSTPDTKVQSAQPAATAKPVSEAKEQAKQPAPKPASEAKAQSVPPVAKPTPTSSKPAVKPAGPTTAAKQESPPPSLRQTPAAQADTKSVKPAAQPTPEEKEAGKPTIKSVQRGKRK